jgi:membrane protein
MMQYIRSTLVPYIQTTVLPSRPVQLLLKAGLKWDRDNCPGMAASLSYYALFSLFPLLLVILSVLGFFLGPNTEAYRSIAQAVQSYMPSEVHDLIKGTLVSLNENSVGAGIIGFSILLFTSSAIFGVLRASVNRIWQSPSRVSEVGSPVKMALFFIVNKLFSFLLVLGSALLLLVSLLADIAVRVILELINTFKETFAFIKVDELQVAKGLQFGSSFLTLAIVACVLFKILPSVYVAWGDVWLSALVAAGLVAGLQFLVSNSIISIGSHFISYGVIGSVMILMLWIFLTFQIFLFGCVLSYIYAHLYGSRRGRSLDTSSAQP